ncbi:MAG: hypothetical protein FWG44_00635 [Oscillospiraceae bacterium]|nr:hypothetical protein [Oscillospiraceae bacterium]
MKTKLKPFVFGVFTLAACLGTFLLVYFINNGFVGNELNDSESDGFFYSTSDYIELSFEEIVSGATHILDAEYIGVYPVKREMLLMFKPNRLIKGDVKDNIIHIAFELSIGQGVEDIKYTEGENYLLFIDRNRSVYREHDIYTERGADCISSKSEDWEKVHEQTFDLMTKFKNTAPEVYGAEFTFSTSITDILKVSPNIFEVEITEVEAKSMIVPVTSYICTVTEVIQGTSFVPKSIYLSLFNDTVKVGETYIVLLSDSSANPVYALSSRNSVYTREKALKIPELKALFND